MRFRHLSPRAPAGLVSSRPNAARPPRIPACQKKIAVLACLPSAPRRMFIRDDSALVQIEETVVRTRIKHLLLTLASIGMAGMATGQVPPPTNIEKLKQMKVATTDLNIPVVPQAGP